jgi:hypothetical protein
MKYALLAYTPPGRFDAMTDEERAAWEADDAEFNAELADRYYIVSGQPFADADTATTVRVEDGAVRLTDGPFNEVAGQLGGIVIIDVPDLDTALDLARRSPATRTGSLEVRPIRG